MNNQNSLASGSTSWLRPASWVSGQDLRGTKGMALLAFAVFLLVAGIGAITSLLRVSSGTIGTSHARTDGEMVGHVAAPATDTASTPEAGKLLPDVSVMIGRLAARLETSPNDIKGWQMLGWSYFNIARYGESAAAYARAVALDPNSAEIKLAYEQAKAKASGGSSAETAASGPPKTEIKSGTGPSAADVARFEAMPQHDREAAIRSMVDSLASRLESAPRDVDGWTRLMRSRIVLGEREVATTAFRKALDIFKDDTAASGRIAATAIELGLTTK